MNKSVRKIYAGVVVSMAFVMGVISSPTASAASGNSQAVAMQQKEGALRTVSGTVMGSDGETLPGATVVVKGQPKYGATTNIDGKFVLTAPKDAKTVVVSYVGFTSQEITLNRQTSYAIYLQPSTDLQEVVVTGIVTKKKDTFTGSSSSFSGKELQSVGVSNPIASLKSLDMAFNVMDNSVFGSDPNRLPDIEIRGKSSMLGLRDETAEDPNQPLFILDGFESDLQTIYNLDINRIESMTILKDAASTAIYGSKAANGVVVVETVKPQPGKLRLSYNGSASVSMADLSSYNLMNSAEKLEFERLAGKYNSNGSADDMVEMDNLYQQHKKDIASGVNTYWLAEPLRVGINHRHSLYVDGGSDGFMFGIGLNYNGVQGVMKSSDRDVFGANLDITYRVGKLQFSNKFNASKTTYDDPVVSFSQYALANPYYKKVDEEGNVSKFLANNAYDGVIGNPIYNDQLNNRNATSQLMLSDYFMAEYNPIRDLKLRAKFGLTYNTREDEDFTSPDHTNYENTDVLKRGSFRYGNTKTTSYEADFTAIYATVLNDDHRINAALGANMAESSSVNQGYTAIGFPSGNFTYPSFSNGFPEGSKPTYYESVSRNASAYFTGGYSFKDRYLADVSYRMNGASVFGSNKKFINTWSIGLGWNIHNESFIKDNVSVINYFKIRGSIGNPGNMNYDSAMSLTTFNYYYSSYNYFGLGSTLSSLGNPDLKWQTTMDRNIGLDLTMFNHRLNIVADYYNKHTDPLLIAIGMPASSGITQFNTNFGNQTSKGFTASAQYYILRDFNSRITWSVRAAVRVEESKIDGIGNTLAGLNNYGKSRTTKRYYDGADPNAIWAVRSAGIDPANGRELFIKKDGTYTYDFSYDDEVIVGSSTPDVEGTFGTNLNYKGFTLGAIFRYRLGAEVFNNAVYTKVENISSSSLAYNQDKRALYDRWQKPGDVAQFKDIANSVNTPMSSRFVQTENTLALESLNLGYEFSPEAARKLGVSGLRLNAYMNDIFRLSNIKSERGTDYPFARSVSFALSFTL